MVTSGRVRGRLRPTSRFKDFNLRFKVRGPSLMGKTSVLEREVPINYSNVQYNRLKCKEIIKSKDRYTCWVIGKLVILFNSPKRYQ
jgi:hypothetical protein